MARPFLTARWRHLALLTFEAPESVLAPLVPAGCEADRWEDRGYVSLVALRMERVRVHGLPVPGLTTYPQVNLRTYLRHESRPSVRFVREIVPSRLVAAVARWRFEEPFSAGHVASRIREDAGGTTVEYFFGVGAASGRVKIRGGVETTVPEPGTFERWVTQRVRGCRTGRDGRLRTFDVSHPPWALRRIEALDHIVEFGALFGREWAFLDTATPVSMLYAVGSDVTVTAPV